MRSDLLLSLRSSISIDMERSSLEIEQFQNSCLRPILKFQHVVLVQFFKSQLGVTEIPRETNKRMMFVTHRLQKDIVLKHVLVGMIAGLMSEDELRYYLENKREITRRITQLLIQRLSDGLASTHD